MRIRIRKNGLDSLHDHEVLETMLYFTIPREDTNPVAHRLIQRFGSLSAVLGAPAEELEKVEGVGPKSAEFLSLFPQYARRYLVSLQEDDRPLETTEDIGRFLCPCFVGESEELAYVVCLDNCRRPLCRICIHRGSVNAVEINVRTVVKIALDHKATGVILAHNHPGGVAVPSQEDSNTTRRVFEALEPLHIDLVDHLVFAGPGESEADLMGDFVSMHESRLMPYQEPDDMNEDNMAAQTMRIR